MKYFPKKISLHKFCFLNIRIYTKVGTSQGDHYILGVRGLKKFENWFTAPLLDQIKIGSKHSARSVLPVYTLKLDRL